MSVSPIVTGGFGSYGSVHLIPTLGFGIGQVLATPFVIESEFDFVRVVDSDFDFARTAQSSFDFVRVVDTTFDFGED